jgi:hypothetical protein
MGDLAGRRGPVGRGEGVLFLPVGVGGQRRDDSGLVLHT